jgi:hypothetical protein
MDSRPSRQRATLFSKHARTVAPRHADDKVGSPPPLEVETVAASEQPTKPEIKRITIALSAETCGRLRAAFLHLPPERRMRVRTFSGMLEEFAVAGVEHLEREHNGGRQWEPVAAGQIPSGRPAAF